jgi:hypothetical protein
MGFMENRKGRFYTLRVAVLGHCLYPDFIAGTHGDFAVDKTAVVRLNTASDNVADNKTCGKDNQVPVRDNIADHYSADSDVRAGYISLYPRALSNHYPALCLYVASDASVYARKSACDDIASKTGIRPYDCVN